ncbi:MAG: hypothetical protein AAB560_03710 [Patescibacteria group bacterium]
MIEGDELIGRVAIQRKLRFLLEMFGGKEEAAEALGASRSQIARWIQSSTPDRKMAAKIENLDFFSRMILDGGRHPRELRRYFDAARKDGRLKTLSGRRISEMLEDFRKFSEKAVSA